jgi:hypothetical protein
MHTLAKPVWSCLDSSFICHLKSQSWIYGVLFHSYLVMEFAFPVAVTLSVLFLLLLRLFCLALRSKGLLLDQYTLTSDRPANDPSTMN